MKKILNHINPNYKEAILVIALVLSFGGTYAYAGTFTEPACGPTGCNTEAPINVSATSQAKAGPLQVNGFRNLGTTVLDGNVGIGTLSPTSALQVVGRTAMEGLDINPSGGGASSISMNASEMNFTVTGGKITMYRPSSPTTGFTLDVNGNIKGEAFFYDSDRQLKTNILSLDSTDSLSKILNLQGVSFSWKANGRKDVGLIAQDVEKVFPDLVSTDKETGLKSVEYGNLIAPLIEAVKAQQGEIDALKKEVEALKK